MAKMSEATVLMLARLHKHNAIYYMQLAIRECLVTNAPVCWLWDSVDVMFSDTIKESGYDVRSCA